MERLPSFYKKIMAKNFNKPTNVQTEDVVVLLGKIYRNGENVLFPKSEKLSRQEWKIISEYKPLFEVGTNFISLNQAGIDGLKFHQKQAN